MHDPVKQTEMKKYYLARSADVLRRSMAGSCVFCCSFVFLTISVEPFVSKSTAPIFDKFSGLALLLLLLLLFLSPPAQSRRQKN